MRNLRDTIFNMDTNVLQDFDTCISVPLITRLIVIDIAPLTVLSCNCPLFYNCWLADL